MRQGKSSYWKIKSRIIAAILILIMTLGILPGGFGFVEQAAAAGTGNDIVLVLDRSGSMSGEPVKGVREAAKQFCTTVLTAGSENRIAIVAFESDTETTAFSNDINELEQAIDEIYANGGTNLCAAMKEAEGLLQSSGRTDAQTSIVLMADGYPESGENSDSGHYTHETLGSIYRYANPVYDFTTGLHATRQVYTVGFLHKLSGTEYTHCEQFLKDLQNAGYYSAQDVDALLRVFGEIAQTIVNPLEIVLSNTPDANNDTPAQSDGHVSDNVYTITAVLKNGNTKSVENIQASLKLPKGMTLDSGENAQKQAQTLEGGKETSVSWKVRVPREGFQDDRTFEYEVAVSTDNTVDLSQVETIFVKGYQAADNRITYKGDTWSFINTSSEFQSTYYLDETVWNALLNRMGQLEPSDIEALRAVKESDWGGSCYGMSSIVVLNKLGLFTPSEWDKNAADLQQMQIKDDTLTESVINFYHLQQSTSTVHSLESKTQATPLQEQLQTLAAQAAQVKNGGNPVLLGFFWGKLNSKGNLYAPGHAVVAYDFEELKKEYRDPDGNAYAYKVKMWNPNFKEDSKDRCMYISKDYTSMYSPEYKASFSHSGNSISKVGDAVIGLLTNDPALIDVVNASNAVKNYKAIVRANSLTEFLIKSGSQGQTVEASLENLGSQNGATVYLSGMNYVEGKENAAQLCTMFENAAEDYSVTTKSEAEKLDLSVSYADKFISAYAESGKGVDFEQAGGVTLKDIKGSFSMDVTCDEQTTGMPWTTVRAQGDGTDSIGIHRKDEGMLVDGASLQNVTVVAENAAVTSNCEIHSNQNSVMLKTENEQLQMYLDLDGDGNYTDQYEKLVSLHFDEDSYEIEQGEEKHLPLTMEPESASDLLVWTSSDVEVAKVDENGTVTGVKEGKATIKVSNYQGDVWQQCTVTVKGGDQPVIKKDHTAAVLGSMLVLAVLILGGVVVAICVAGTGKKSRDAETGTYSDEEEWAKDNIYELLETPSREVPTDRLFTGKITGVTGTYAGVSINLQSGEEIIIGKDARVAQLIIDPSFAKVSRKHCGIRYNQQENMYYVIDYSLNGTYLESGEALAKNTYTKVKPGTMIYLSRRSLMFKLEAK